MLLLLLLLLLLLESLEKQYKEDNFVPLQPATNLTICKNVIQFLFSFLLLNQAQVALYINLRKKWRLFHASDASSDMWHMYNYVFFFMQFLSGYIVDQIRQFH